MSRLDRACALFAKRAGVAVLEGEEAVAVVRWLGAGALTEEQKQVLLECYNGVDK